MTKRPTAPSHASLAAFAEGLCPFQPGPPPHHHHPTPPHPTPHPPSSHAPPNGLCTAMVQKNYHDLANVDDAEQERRYQQTRDALKPWQDKTGAGGARPG
jgi:hypothetical protein